MEVIVACYGKVTQNISFSIAELSHKESHADKYYFAPVVKQWEYKQRCSGQKYSLGIIWNLCNISACLISSKEQKIPQTSLSHRLIYSFSRLFSILLGFQQETNWSEICMFLPSLWLHVLAKVIAWNLILGSATVSLRFIWLQTHLKCSAII